MDRSLQNAVDGYKRLREALLAAYPQLADDEQALVDTLDGIADFDTAVEAVIRSALDDEALVAAIKLRTGDLSERKARLEHRAATKRAAVLSAMQAADRKKLERAEFTLSVSAGRAGVRITDETAIPGTYLTTPPPVPNKALIGDTLRAGLSIPGAELSNAAPHLTVRVK